MSEELSSIAIQTAPELRDADAESATFGTNSASGSFAMHSSAFDDFEGELPKSISPRDKLSYVEDKKVYKEAEKFMRKNEGIYLMIRMMKTEVLRVKPDNVLDFINDEFFSLENQTKWRNMLKKD